MEAWIKQPRPIPWAHVPSNKPSATYGHKRQKKDNKDKNLNFQPRRLGSFTQRTAKGQRKGATSKNVKKCQELSKIIFDTFENFRAAPIFRPLLGGLWFTGAGTRFKHCKKRINSTPREFAFGRTKIPGQNLDDTSEFSKCNYLGCWLGCIALDVSSRAIRITDRAILNR